MKKITLFLSVLLMAMVVKAQSEPAPVVKMTYVNYDAPTTAIGEVATGETAMAGYNKISGGSVGFPSTIWEVNYITYIQVDASSYTDLIIGATLTVDMSGSTDNKRATAWGVGYNSSVWSADMTYETADKSITTLGDVQWTSTTSSTTFETKTFDIYDALKNDEDKIVTLVVYETAAAGGYIKNPQVTIKVGEAIAATGISLDKSTAEITEGMVMNLLTATVVPDNTTDKTVTWSSSDENIATVDGGQVTGVAVGTATITATTINGFTATCEVSVKEKVVKTSWDFAALQASLPNKTGMTYAVNTVKVGGVDCSYGIGEYEGLAVQGAASWFLYTDGGLYNGNGGGRNIGVLNLKKGQIVTVVANTELTLADATTATQLSVETADGKSTYKYGMKADGTLALNMVRNKVIVSIDVEESKILVVTDGENLDAEGTYEFATYTRTVNPDYNYGTICLPFAPDAATLENYTFYTLSATGADALTFTEVETPEAYIPYLYSAKDKEATTHTFTGGETEVASDPESYTECGSWMFFGALSEEYIPVADMGQGMMYYAYKPTAEDGDVLVKATKSLEVKPYRAYFITYGIAEWGPDLLSTMRIVVRGAGDNGDGTTGIEEVITPDQIEGAAPAIYNLMGQPVAQPVKGQIYIVNGKKVVY